MISFTQLEGQKAEMLARVETWPPARLSYRPGPGQWSVNEMLDHIVKSETAILAATRAGLARPHSIGVIDRIRTRFLEWVFRSDRRVKVPATAKVVLPDQNVDLPGIRVRWDATRASLGELLAAASPAEMRSGSFHHPVGGWMNIPEVLNFFSTHLIHHTYQLTRLEEASRESENEVRRT